jgi:hypothetical protein
MNERRDGYDETWFNRLDAIVTGKETPSPEDDELLHVAAKLSDALASTRGFDSAGERNRWPTRAHLQPRQSVSSLPVPSFKRRLFLRGLLAVAALLFVLFGVGGACTTSPQVSAATVNAGRQFWQAATSFEQFDASSVALLSLKNAGVRPLLPVELPAGTQSVEFGIITDNTNPHIFTAFAADYRVTGQDISVYERPADLVLPSSAAQSISIGSIKGQLFQDDAGNSILRWYQNGMTCQMASTLPANELVAIARQFQPIRNWELIL